MLRKIVSLSLQFRYLVLLCAAALILIGGLQLRTKPVDLLPEFGPLEVEVQTEALGLAAAEVEALLTNPLEEILTGVPWLDDMRSNSITGLSSVVLTFKPGTDMMNARQMVQERLLQASVLPKVSKPPTMLQPVSSLNRAMQVGLSSDTQSLIDLSILARWKIKPRLMSVPGVANVSIWGQRERQLQVQVDPEKLKEKGVQLNDVIRAAGDALWVSPLTFLRASTPGTGGFIDTPTQRYDIRHVLPISSPEHLASISFPAADGSTLRLSDVATVVEGHQPMIGDGIVKDAPGLLLMVEKFPGANTQEVTKGIERALVALKPGLPGVNITSDVFRPASFIETSLSNLASALIVGGILAVAALVLMLRDWRAGLISLVVIPLSLLAAWTALVLFGMTINAIILAGLVAALVAVVDDAIVDVDNIRRRLREAQGAEPASATVFMAAIEVRRPVLHATVIVALATLPILFVQGAAGALLQPLFV
jgi:Cu/Ag efflux pump CusA